MTKIDAERLIQELQNIPSGQSFLEHSLSQILRQADKQLGEAIRLCSIPHWFNAEILGVLRQDTKDMVVNEKLFEAIVEYSFVQVDADGLATYHEEVRKVLIHWWQQKDNLRQYKLVSQWLSNYFLATYNSQEIIRNLQAQQRTRENLLQKDLLYAVEAIF
ncbi:MAG: hypothetical protein KDE51_16790, partial [Anaerolineales bacterium]|nr:hypothetical protein [Anaerolineales bacterium]